MKEYTDLDVWMEARKLANMTYTITKDYPKDELYGLINQLRRCAVSIPSNIAEGIGRQTAKDIIHFLHMARGSIYELETQIYISMDQKYISDEQFDLMLKQITSCKKLINGFVNYYKKL